MTTFQRIRRAAPIALVAALVLPAGCGSGPPGSVKGTITVGGKPLPRGLIVFLPQEGKNDPINVAIIDGAYDSTPLIPPGLAKIYIIPSSTPPATGGNDILPSPKRNPANDPNAVPVKYQTVETSGLTVTVKAGQTITFDKDLTP